MSQPNDNPRSAGLLYEAVGERVRERRVARGLTQEMLAQMVGLTRTSITNLERGRQKLLLHTFVELANALKTSVGELLPPTQANLSAEAQSFDKLADDPQARQFVERALAKTTSSRSRRKDR